LLQKRKEAGQDTYGLFIDLIKAFDSISREALFLILRRYGMPDHFVNIIIRLHTEANISIAMPGGSDPDAPDVVVDSTIGVRQGSNEGPVLFLFFMLAVFHTLEWPPGIEPLQYRTQSLDKPSKAVLHSFSFMTGLFADDCFLAFEKYDKLDSGTRYLHSHMRKLGLNMHVGRPGVAGGSKTVAILFPADTKKYDSGKKDKIELQDELGPCFVEFSTSIIYLGHTIEYTLTSKADIEAKITRAKQAFGAVGKSLLRSRLLNIRDKGKLFVSLVVSILLYGCECWTMTQKLHGKLTSFYNSCVRKMCRRTNWRTTYHQRIHSVDLRQRLGIKSFDDYYTKRLLHWAGHVARLPISRLPRKFLFSEAVAGPYSLPSTRRGSWINTVNLALTAVGIFNKKDERAWMNQACDRQTWRQVTSIVISHLYASKSQILPTEPLATITATPTPHQLPTTATPPTLTPHQPPLIIPPPQQPIALLPNTPPPVLLNPHLPPFQLLPPPRHRYPLRSASFNQPPEPF
jgi:hypothetical protein